MPPDSRSRPVPALSRQPRRAPAGRRNLGVTPQQLLALFTAQDLEALIDAGFELLRTTVACDFASAFYRSAADGLMKARDSRGRRYSSAFMRRHVEFNPAIPLAGANRDLTILPTRTGLTMPADKLRTTEFYREIMKPLGWRHSVALCFWGDPPAEFPIFVASVERREGRRDFSARDIAILEKLHPFLNCAVDRIHEREASLTVRDGMAAAVVDEARGLAILDRQLCLVQADRIARQLCTSWLEEGDEVSTPEATLAWRLPPDLAVACRELHREWAACVRADPDTTGLRRQRVVPHASVPDLTATITMVGPNTAGLAEPTFVIELDRRVNAGEPELVPLSVPLLEKLTAAERAVALVLSDGHSNQEIADRLGKTVHAVKFLLHRVYAKTGVSNRAALVAALHQ